MISRGSIVVMAIGGALLIISIAHHSQEWMRITSRLGPIIAVIIDGGLAISLISAGWWLRKQQTILTPDEKWAIALWTGCGAVIGAGITSVIFGVLSLEGRPISEPIFVLLVATGSGGVVMFTAGYQATLQRATRQRYDTLVNDAEQFIGLLQLDGTVIEVNDTALTFGGIERSDVIGRKFANISWWTHSESVHNRVQSALERAADGEFVRYETDVRGIGGLRRIRFSAKPIADNSGNVKQILVEGTDMSDQHRQQQHLQVLYRIFRHDMRNDVMKIRGWTHEVATAATREERVESSERVGKILDSWDKMFSDLQEIQDAISVDADGDGDRTGDRQQPLQPVEEVVSAAIDTHQSTHSKADIDIDIEYGSPQTRDEHRAGDIHEHNRNRTRGNEKESLGLVPQWIQSAVEEILDDMTDTDTSSMHLPTIDLELFASQDGAWEGETDTNTPTEKTDRWVYIRVSADGAAMSDADRTVLETGEETPLTHGTQLDLWKVRMVITQAGGSISVSGSDDRTVISLRLPSRVQ